MQRLVNRLILSIALSLAWLSTVTAAPAPAALNPAALYQEAFAMLQQAPGENPPLPEPSVGGITPAEVQMAIRFDGPFRLLEQARQSTAPCDWGIDLRAGPEAHFPPPSQIRELIRAARLRARVAWNQNHLQEGNRDILAAYALARNAAAGGTLVAAMMSIGAEESLTAFLSQNLHRLDATALARLEAGLQSLPPSGSVAAALKRETTCSLGWWIETLERCSRADPADPSLGIQEARETWSRLVEGNSPGGSFASLLRDAGETLPGLMRQARAAEPLFQAMVDLASQAPAELRQSEARLEEMHRGSPSLLYDRFAPNAPKARRREIETSTRSVMLLAAIALKLRGEEGFRKVPEPFGGGPFILDRNDDGFEIVSHLERQGFNVRLEVPAKPEP
ncbi:MAG TPA: hypothetical protein DCM86_09755 [Verrucomicrobiales bacterium]|nr:hypothetical protein [Verrucomicrobiales bacterium]